MSLILALLFAQDTRTPLDAFKTAFKEAKTASEKAQAIYSLANLPDKDPAGAKAIAPALAPTPADPNYVVPTAACRALATFQGEPAAATAILKAVEIYKGDPFMFRKLVLTLGEIGHESALPLFAEWLHGNDPKPALLAVEAMVRMPPEVPIEFLIRQYADMETRLKDASPQHKQVYDAVMPGMTQAVIKLTGEGYPTMKEYQVWWGKQGPGFVEDQRARRLEKKSPAAGTLKPFPPLMVEFQFNERTGDSAANTGTTARTHPKAERTGPAAGWTRNAPPIAGAGPSAVRLVHDKGENAFDVPGVILPLSRLASFTITGWVNCASDVTGATGNRLLHWQNGGKDGVDLILLADGSLRLGVNKPAMASEAKSTPGRIPPLPKDPKGADFPNNWRFFAVTYDSTAPSGHATFYSGSPVKDAVLDASCDLAVGPVGPRIGTLTLGNVNPATRATVKDGAFAGILDEVRIFGSATDGLGALTLEDILKVQNRPTPPKKP